MARQQHGVVDYWCDMVFDDVAPGYNPRLEAAATADYRRLLMWVRGAIRLGRHAVRVLRPSRAGKLVGVQGAGYDNGTVAVSVPE